jgi:hypothetical protein
MIRARPRRASSEGEKGSVAALFEWLATPDERSRKANCHR